MEGGCPKVILIIINIIFMILGLAFLVCGIILKVSFDVIKEAMVAKADDVDFNLKDAGDILAVGLIIFGCFILLLSILGCTGALCRFRVLLVVYAIIVIIILVAELAFIILAVIKGNEGTSNLQKGMLESLKGYHEGPKSKTVSDESFDAIFSMFGCCGVNNYTDFRSAAIGTNWDARNPQHNIPVTCCRGVKYEDITDKTFIDHTPCLTSPTKDNAYIEGCYSGIMDVFNKYRGIVIGVAAGFFLLEILVVIMAFYLCCVSGDDSYKV